MVGAIEGRVRAGPSGSDGCPPPTKMIENIGVRKSRLIGAETLTSYANVLQIDLPGNDSQPIALFVDQFDAVGRLLQLANLLGGCHDTNHRPGLRG